MFVIYRKRYLWEFFFCACFWNRSTNMSVVDRELVPNPAENQARNDVDRPREPEHVPQVRKISRFQVSHVREEDKLPKMPNIVHAGDILLENISPEQQAQVAVAHNIQSPVDNSPDKIESMVCLGKGAYVFTFTSAFN